jgi:N-acetylmuramic acid 6-phosphate etherase
MTSLDQLATEQSNPRTADLDVVETLGVLERVNAEDQQVALAVQRVLPELARAVDLTLERWQRGGRVVLFGAGTSGRLAMLDAAELPPTFGISADRYVARMAGGPSAFLRAVEGAEDDRAAGLAAAADLGEADIVVGIAASGRTPWVLGALEAAGSVRALRIGLACVPSPELCSLVDVCIAVETGPEVVAGSTRMKAGTAQKLVLNAFSTGLMVRLGKVYGNLMIDVVATNAKLRHRATRLVQQVARVDAATAERALQAAGGNVKVAAASLRLGVSAEEAARRLDAADGHLRRVLQEA